MRINRPSSRVLDMRDCCVRSRSWGQLESTSPCVRVSSGHRLNKASVCVMREHGWA